MIREVEEVLAKYGLDWGGSAILVEHSDGHVVAMFVS